MRHGRRNRPQADPLHDAEPPNELDDAGGELVPAEIRLGAGQHQQVAPVEPRPADDEVRPVEPRQAAVDDVERGPP